MKIRLVVAGALVCTVAVGLSAAPGAKKSEVRRPATSTSAAVSGSGELIKADQAPEVDAKPNSASEIYDDLVPVPALENPRGEIKPTSASTSGGQPINMDWYSINNGGAIEVAAGNIKMGLSIGQNAVGEVSSGNIKMGLGFWYGATGTGAGCDCLCHADPICDSIIDILDVSQIVNVAFRNEPAIPDPGAQCAYFTTDVDCSNATDILDVTRVVNVAFRNGNPAEEFCNPCPLSL
jgi:hypothetical protein